MSDITDTHFEAAMIDQKVAGILHDRRYAFVAVPTEDRGWQLGVAIINEGGYCPISGKTFFTRDEAAQWADGLNRHVGLSVIEVQEIIVSSMVRSVQ